ncbi:hypothetical protein L202_04878 [Cryptococcus amylolentus CBS 6039]|uniref:Uncharacterized protein n=1 Tax=Cryptococcus amylolentus CBS 6039 TaxID=1295533 RepID=A0A1E3HN14_9TREE|nr:hypothetical protein L202_04878 [Cryptococcus amylolentus CBS 6039]ODN77739.1 hypothetical protein L202_04878 [Cryptococcus amylolentus CBS 6039]
MPTHAANKSKGTATTRRRSYDASQGTSPAPKRARTANWSKDLGTDGNSAEYHLVQWLIMRSGTSMRAIGTAGGKRPKAATGVAPTFTRGDSVPRGEGLLQPAEAGDCQDEDRLVENELHRRLAV